MRLTSEERGRLDRFFHNLNAGGVRYVILRGHPDLPEAIPGSDIDIYVFAGDHADALAIASRSGLAASRRRRGRGLRRWLGLARRPRLLYRRAEGLISLLAAASTGAAQSATTRMAIPVAETQVLCGRIKVDIANHVYHKLPFPRPTFIVPSAVEQSLIDNRIKSGPFYVPAPEDELLHILCRCLFDNDGYFKDHHIDRCEDLKSLVLQDAARNHSFAQRLEMIFPVNASDIAGALADSRYTAMATRPIRKTLHRHCRHRIARLA